MTSPLIYAHTISLHFWLLIAFKAICWMLMTENCRRCVCERRWPHTKLPTPNSISPLPVCPAGVVCFRKLGFDLLTGL